MSQATMFAAPATPAAAVTLAPATLGKLRRLTGNNCHSEAYIAASQALGQPELEQKFKQILSKQQAAGQLTFELNSERYALYQELMAKAKGLLSPEQYKKFHMCF